MKTKQFQHGQVAAASRSQTPQPKLVIDKYPAIKPPAADFLEKVELETSTADPPPYNANGQQAAKKRRRRGKQNENGKKQKVACDDEDGDEDCDEGSEADQAGGKLEDEGKERKEEEQEQPILQKPKKAATKPPAAKKNKAKEAAKPPAQKPSSKGKAAKKSDPPVPEPIKEKDKDDSGEPIKEKKQGKGGDREPIKENKQGKNGDGGDASIPSLEEVKAKGGFAPPDHVCGNNIYSNAYRQSLKESNDVEAAKKRGRYAAAIFKQHHLVIPGMCGKFRGPRQAKKATEDAKAKGKTADCCIDCTDFHRVTCDMHTTGSILQVRAIRVLYMCATTNEVANRLSKVVGTAASVRRAAEGERERDGERVERERGL